MKKTYNKPITEVNEIEVHQLLSVSIPVGDNYNGTAEIESRSFEFDYDEEE